MSAGAGKGAALDPHHEASEPYARHLVPGGMFLINDVSERPEGGGRTPWNVDRRAAAEGFGDVSATGSLRVLVRR